jgi:predicted RNA-binding Zn-ribbon protein involved in translation (DUF1610 family)
MSSLKTHFAVSPVSTACGRGKRTSSNVQRVDCSNCQRQPAFRTAQAEQEAARVQAFMAQAPRRFIEPWQSASVTMTCKSCGGQEFREGDRTCYGHYANYHCANCGGVESRLTETGMSF